MKRVTLGLAVVASFIYVDASAQMPEITKQPESKSKLLNFVYKVENRKEIPNDELQNQVSELSERNFVLEKEISLLKDQLQKLRNNIRNKDDEIEKQKIKLQYSSDENEELLKKLSEYQKNTQERAEIPFELNSLLNQISTEDEITKDCVEFLQDLTDLDRRIDQIFNKSIEQDSDLVYQIKGIEQEITTKQKLLSEKLDIYENHEIKLLERCNENKNKLPEQINHLHNQITEELKKYPELSNLKLEENLMNNNIIKTFRQNQPAEQAEEIKSLEKSLHEYYGLKIQESDLHVFEKRTQNFSDNIAKIKLLTAAFIEKYDRLEFLKNEALKSIENAQTTNDNQTEEDN